MSPGWLNCSLKPWSEYGGGINVLTWWPWSAPPGPSVEEGMPGGASSAVSAGRDKKVSEVSEGHSV